jgi:hypothetical protein
MSTAAAFLNIEKALDTTWHLGLLHKLCKLKFSISPIKLISSFLSQRKCRISVEGEMFTPKDIQAEVSQDSILSPTLYSIYIYIYIYINDTAQTPGVCLGLFADDTCIYVTDRNEGSVLRNLQRSLSAIETWCERWNTKLNEDKTQAFCFTFIYFVLAALIALFYLKYH